ncbi:MAG: outer membrane lipoprotein-sorting protein [Gammaproteobacteria bacterium]|nr:outer membrane lipoprotein-sorting protein [Gammaproteobacteria bacterium]
MTRLFVLLLISLLTLHNAFAQTPEERGLEIAIEADRRDSGFGDQVTAMRMTLRNAAGKTSIREVRIKTLEVEGDGDKSISIFDQPRDVKGTAFLSYTHSKKADDQWLFLPALKRVKRIASRNKSGPFMGSEFSFEDIASFEVDKYTYKYLRDEEIDGRPLFVIEQFPTYEFSGYTRRIVWLDQEMYQPLKTEFYDRKNSLLKTLTQYDYQKYNKQYWRADRFEMINHQTKKSTTLEWHNYQFQTGLSDRDFDQNSLKRAR